MIAAAVVSPNFLEVCKTVPENTPESQKMPQSLKIAILGAFFLGIPDGILVCTWSELCPLSFGVLWTLEALVADLSAAPEVT